VTGALTGKQIVNTRALHQAGEMDRLLQARKAVPIAYPCIDIAPPLDTDPLDEALHRAAQAGFDWLILTSANTVLSLSRRLDVLGLPTSMLNQMKIAAVGPTTAEAARALLGIETSLLPDEYVAEALIEAFRAPPGTRVLLPQSDIARPVLAEGLAAAGLNVTSVVAYRTVPGSGGADVPALLKAGKIDAIIFTSTSTIENFIQRMMREGGDLATLDGICIACVGPVTARAAVEHGLTVAVIPDNHTLEGLIASLEIYFLEAKKASWPTHS
jgi:uroporphyrinogen-III synthase/uroporphyrinogen III methyltransferase/synthase